MIYCCKDCIRRYVGCHTDCEDYNNALEEDNNKKEKIKKQLAKEHEYMSYIKSKRKR